MNLVHVLVVEVDFHEGFFVGDGGFLVSGLVVLLKFGFFHLVNGPTPEKYIIPLVSRLDTWVINFDLPCSLHSSHKGFDGRVVLAGISINRIRIDDGLMGLFMRVKRGVVVVELIEDVGFENFVAESGCRKVHWNFIYLYWLICNELITKDS